MPESRGVSTGLRAVFFDFGGTLFSYRSVRGRAFYPFLIEALERLGVDVEPREAGRAFRVASTEAFLEHHPRSYYLHRDLYQDTFRRFAARLGREGTRELCDWFHEEQRDLVYRGFELRPDCIETLKVLRAEGLYLAIVSNIDDDYLHPMVERAGLDAHLDDWTSSEEARSCKPDSGIYHAAMSKAPVTPDASLFVGDSPVADIEGARRLGMPSVLLREPGDSPPEGPGPKGPDADYEVEALRDLVPIVRRLRGSGA